jgi:uncharacterized protein (TIGR00299 family) protein
MHIHLDPVGGVAGDMFVAALLDAFPDLERGLVETVQAAGAAGIACRLERHRDKTLQGRRFVVETARPHHHHHHDHDHDHVHWAEIREHLTRTLPDPDILGHALGIFGLLAGAEARVHGVCEDEVAFHEVGAADSIADIVGAAFLIASLKARSWSTAPLPLGSGRIRTAHGVMPVPAPATVLLLEGLPTLDDGLEGERVTPTGAAILRYLGCAAGAAGEPRLLGRTGIGFGTKTFPDIPNCLRVLTFERLPGQGFPQMSHRELAVLEFEVDDQSPEDLALGLDRLRALAGVYDVIQMPAFGKKGRMLAHIQLLGDSSSLDSVIAACFRETTTIGLRWRITGGAALNRRTEQVEARGRLFRVKVVDRPGAGATAKAEIEDVAGTEGGAAARTRLRAAAEDRALDHDAGSARTKTPE